MPPTVARRPPHPLPPSGEVAQWVTCKKKKKSPPRRVPPGLHTTHIPQGVSKKLRLVVLERDRGGGGGGRVSETLFAGRYRGEVGVAFVLCLQTGATR